MAENVVSSKHAIKRKLQDDRLGKIIPTRIDLPTVQSEPIESTPKPKKAKRKHRKQLELAENRRKN